jgi:predicted helicase
MSRVLIQHYLAELSKLRQVSGTHRESVVREAFKDLLKGWARSHDLTFVPEYEIESPAKERRYVDGALLYGLRLPFGYWEAKDSKDDLDKEIDFKLRRGYPQDNIVFEDSTQAVLIQNKRETMRCAVDDVDKLQRLLELFFGYERPEIAEFRKAVEQFKTDLPAVLESLRARIAQAHADNAAFREASEKFLKQAQETINPALTAADVREILIQHILTEEIFSVVFPDTPFHKDNNIARELYKLEATFFTGNTKFQALKALEVYYRAIRAAAGQIGSHHEKQTFLKVVYENFYKVYNPKAADRLGVVYTPNEIVRFMIESTDWLCEQHFGRNLIDPDVEILDPAAGTGTFISELLEHFRGQPAKLKHKYLEELHANEVAILPYYVANLNIEATYAAISGEYLEYPNLCFVDTLDNVAGLRRYTGQQIADLFGMGEENIERIKRQNRRKISVVIGNPPYNANQANENDNNKNREYPEIDARIKDTYIKASTAQKTKRYDMYSRFYRWASDRISENGIVAFITNRNFLDAREADGFRKSIVKEFGQIYVIDLGGDLRQNRHEAAANVFGIKVGVAIAFLVRGGKMRKSTAIKYARCRGEKREDRLAALGTDKFTSYAWDTINPSPDGTWLGQSDTNFDQLIPLINKIGRKDKAIFSVSGLGVSTNRDAWLLDVDRGDLMAKVVLLCERYASSTSSFDPAIKWSETLKRHRKRGAAEAVSRDRIRQVQYRPFCTKLLYDSDLFIDRRGVLRLDQAKAAEASTWLAVSAGRRSEFGLLASLLPPSLDHFVPNGTVGIPRFGGAATDNITDWALKQFKDHYKAHGATGDESPTSSFRRKPESSLSFSITAQKLDPGFCRDDERVSVGVDDERVSAMATSAGKRAPLSALRAPSPARRGRDSKAKARSITKEAIFHYVYAVLHDPLYREKYAQNLKREFPRIPFYADFWQWAEWGRALMELHIGYETVDAWPLARTDTPDEKARTNGAQPKALLKADKDAGRIALDSETTLAGIPPEAWDYKLGNRSALEWILDQYKEKKPKDPTIRAKFNTYRFADHKEKVIDLLARVTRVSVETQAIVVAMRSAAR